MLPDMPALPKTSQCAPRGALDVEIADAPFRPPPRELGELRVSPSRVWAVDGLVDPLDSAPPAGAADPESAVAGRDESAVPLLRLRWCSVRALSASAPELAR
jgi:hypothetical protein